MDVSNVKILTFCEIFSSKFDRAEAYHSVELSFDGCRGKVGSDISLDERAEGGLLCMSLPG